MIRWLACMVGLHPFLHYMNVVENGRRRGFVLVCKRCGKVDWFHLYRRSAR